jgi:hypothetical protein
MKIWKWHLYFLILKKPLPANRLAAIKQGKAWIKVKGKLPANPMFNVAPKIEEVS